MTSFHNRAEGKVKCLMMVECRGASRVRRADGKRQMARKTGRSRGREGRGRRGDAEAVR